VAPSPRAAARGCLMVDGSLPGLCLSGLRGPRWHLRLAHDERAALRPLRPPGLRQPLPAHPRPPRPALQRLATAGEADRREPRRDPRLGLPRLASRAAPGATRRTRCRPSGAARPRWRAATRPPWCALRELQRAQGPEPAAAVRPALAWAPGWGTSHVWDVVARGTPQGLARAAEFRDSGHRRRNRRTRATQRRRVSPGAGLLVCVGTRSGPDRLTDVGVPRGRTWVSRPLGRTRP
jgi:hypothetical protein